jgi:hypothetical protein
MATHYEPKEKKSKLEEAFAYVEKKMSGVAGNPAGTIINEVDRQRERPLWTYSHKYKSMKGK